MHGYGNSTSASNTRYYNRHSGGSDSSRSHRSRMARPCLPT